MPKLTLMFDRKTVQVYDIDRPVIRVATGDVIEIAGLKLTFMDEVR